MSRSLLSAVALPGLGVDGLIFGHSCRGVRVRVSNQGSLPGRASARGTPGSRVCWGSGGGPRKVVPPRTAVLELAG